MRVAVVLLSIAALSLASGTRRAGAQSVLHIERPGPAGAFGFAYEVAIVGDFIAVGAVSGGDGAVRLFDRASGALVRSLTNPNVTVPFSGFAASLAAIGTNLAVGAPYDESGPGRGAAYLFDPASGALLQTFYTNETPGFFVENFGGSLAQVGGNLIVGAARETAAGETYAGRAYLFDATTGALLLTLQSPTPQDGGLFGFAVQGRGGNILVGAPREEPSPGVGGTAYLFDGITGALLQQYVNPTPTAECGYSLAALASGGVVVGCGSRYAHLFDGATGALLRTFSDPCPTCGLFGYFGLASLGNHVLVSAPDADDGGVNAGAVYVFDATTGAITQTFLNPTPTEPHYGPPWIEDDSFGQALAVADGTIAVGAPGDEGSGRDEELNRGSGAVQVFYGGLSGCGPCETSGPLGTCVAGPNPTCRTPDAPGRAVLKIANSSPDERDVFSWRWRGRAKMIDDFDHPLIHDYALCLFDESGPTPSLLFRALAPAGGTCAGAACWQMATRTNRVLYRDRDDTPDGLHSMNLIGGGTTPKGRITLRAKGANLSNRALGLPTLPPPLPLRIQLQARDGLCWESRHSIAGPSTTTRLTSQSD